jgi:carboxypeptidase Taq
MSYAQLSQKFAKIGRLQEVEAIVEWDQAVNMPEAAGASRAEAMATLSVVWHELQRDPKLGDLFAAAEQEANLDPWQRANLDEMRRQYVRARAVPLDLVEARTRATKQSELVWRTLRQQNDFAAFAPYLEEVVKRTRDTAQALGEALGLSPYDALLDDYEPGARCATIDPVFADLEAFLPGFIEQVLARQAGEQVLVPEGPFPVAAQRALGLALMVDVGFDPARGRLDTSHHAFCGGVPRDVRITTRYDENDFSSSLMGVLHEAGHGKYEQALPERWRHQPVGLARGMMLHESQSLLQEMQIARGRPFLTFAAPKMRQAFAEAVARAPKAFELDNLVRWYNRVERSLIRVDADEVTYPAHILLRYDIERRLVAGTLSVSELPEVWDAGMQRLLGLSTAGNDRDGCMQDVHWPAGLFGYFPLYTLGAMAAAQFYAALERARPGLDAELSRGDFAFVNAWLSEHVWQRASSVTSDVIIEDATGQPLDAAFFRRHLERRYLEQ